MQTSSSEINDSVSVSIEQWAEVAPGLDVSPMQVFGRIHQIFIKYQAELARVFSAHGINAASFGALAVLYRAGEPYRMTVTRISKETLVSSGGITLRLDRLEEAELIVRDRDREDRRLVYAQLTEKGLQVVRAAAVDHFTNEARLLAGMSDGDREQLARLLAILLRQMDQAGPAPVDSSSASR